MFLVITPLIVYGYVSSNDVIEAIDKHKNEKVEIYNDFLYIGKKIVITTAYEEKIYIMKYYIVGVGGVFRYTKASEKIDSIYNKLNPELTKRQKLGLDEIK